MRRAPPAALAGVDLDAHRERAFRALVLFFGGENLSVPPEHWQDRARAVLAILDAYGVAPVWVYDPKFSERSMLGAGPGA
jgi:hypothetical protein